MAAPFYSSVVVWGAAYVIIIFVYATIYAYGLPADTWRDSGVESIWDGFYVSIVSITTLGLGDICPTSSLGRFWVATEALLGVIVIGGFLNAIAMKVSTKAANEEKAMLQYIDRLRNKELLFQEDILLQPFIGKFKYALCELVTPPHMRVKENMDERLHTFKFQDMYQMYDFSGKIASGVNKPVIELYYKSLDNVCSRLDTMLSRTDIHLWPELREIIREFLFIAELYDYRDLVLAKLYGYGDIAYKERKLEEIVEQIKSHPTDNPILGKDKDLNVYIALYLMAKKSVEFLDKYEAFFYDLMSESK